MVSFLLVLSSLTAVQTEAPDPARVRRLIQLLDDEQMANRQAAEQALVAFGPEVLSLLPEIAQQRSPEVKERLAHQANAADEDGRAVRRGHACHARWRHVFEGCIRGTRATDRQSRTWIRRPRCQCPSELAGPVVLGSRR